MHLNFTADRFTKTGTLTLPPALEPVVRTLAAQIAREQPQMETAHSYNPDGSVAFEKRGGPSSVEFTQAESVQCARKPFVHNHPNGRSLSIQDAVWAAQYGFTNMQAIGVNDHGEVWHYQLASAPHADWPKPEELTIAYTEEDARVPGRFQEMIDTGVLGYPDANAYHHHGVWMAMAERFPQLRYQRTFLGHGARQHDAPQARGRGAGCAPPPC